MVPRTDTIGSIFRDAAAASGFVRHGRACYRPSDELLWVVTPEQVFRGPSWAIRVALVARRLAPDAEWPTDSDAQLQTEARFLARLFEPGSTEADALDGPAISEALYSESSLSLAGRRDALQVMSTTLYSTLSHVESLTTLAAIFREGRLKSALVSSSLRELLDSM